MIWVQSLTAVEPPASKPFFEFDARLVRGATGCVIIVNLQNLDQSNQLDRLAVRLENQRGTIERQAIGELGERQSRYLRFSAPRECASPWVVVDFVSGNRSNSMVRLVSLPPKEESGFLTSVLPAVVSIISVIIGAYLVHCLTLRQERIKHRLEWRKAIFEKYEQAYRDFISGWGGESSVEVFTKQFEKLQSRALVPLGVVQEFRKACQVLESSGSTDEQKHQAVAKFRDLVDEYLLEV
jgi:hypothetical protein